MATTAPDNLYSPDGSNAYNIPAETGAMQASVQAALVQRANFYRGTSGQRTALSTAGGAMNGTYWSDTNGTQELYRYNGSAWISQTPGDTGWVNMTTYQNSFTDGGPTPAYRVRNGFVYLSGQLYRSTAPTSALPAIALPVGCPRPRGLIIESKHVGWGVQVEVTTTGVIQVASNTARTSGAGYTLDGTSWPV